VTPAMAKILIVEDENDLARALAINLRREGHEVVHVARGDAAVAATLREAPDLVLLDVMLPGMTGLDVCRALRARRIETPIVMLTARAEEVDRVVGLEIGADDYVTKPFGLRELVARINVRLRRDSARVPARQGRATFGAIEVDFDGHRVSRRGRDVELSAKEFDLLRALIEGQGRVVTRQHLLREVWGYDQAPNSRTIDTHVLKLRQKLEDDPAAPRFLLSVYGEGYRWVG
jgi:DNA-binding response OmpR family regulator